MLALPAAAAAQMIPSLADLPTGYRPDSWHVFNGAAVGLNGPVLGDQLKIYRKMPWGGGKTLLTSDSHWRVGSHNTITPAYIRPAIMLGVSPLLILDLDFHYGPIVNVTDYEFSSFDDNYDPMNMGDADLFFTIRHEAQMNATFKIGAGPIALLSMTDLDYWYADDYWFCWEIATIMRDGWSLRSKTFLLYEFVKNWRVFLNYENYNYYESDYMYEVASSGFVVMHPEWDNFLVILQFGYHVHNPDFEGIKFWGAVVNEWDFPEKPKR
jgi:hypothetical protein